MLGDSMNAKHCVTLHAFGCTLPQSKAKKQNMSQKSDTHYFHQQKSQKFGRLCPMVRVRCITSSIAISMPKNKIFVCALFYDLRHCLLFVFLPKSRRYSWTARFPSLLLDCVRSLWIVHFRHAIKLQEQRDFSIHHASKHRVYGGLTSLPKLAQTEVKWTLGILQCSPVKALQNLAFQDAMSKGQYKGSSYGYGSKLNRRGYAGFGPCFHLPGFHFGIPVF